ncbi:sulfur carrier protein ThiS [Oceanicella actignis]|uniref:Sulfur carrier protein n=1 Tax=Oceanicella actignis TaxID=1189325 RepID=A0A1M7RT44_9RHOB|nr:sulfur carrier protein ThiS [Oceanicella actignis]TYO89480.1 sulfur carrier protein [Oceanicella actignis]SET05340.1 sulfur carrier protein [Oceanicella actignis]SHN49306.1 sulfur carrier protein [Oceanicella actignis]
MLLRINGEPARAGARNLAELIEALGHDPRAVATARNGRFVPASARAQEPLAEGDEIEIVSPRQGG